MECEAYVGELQTCKLSPTAHGSRQIDCCDNSVVIIIVTMIVTIVLMHFYC